jgi:hypothetical protein
MTKFVSRRGTLGIAKEATRGTPVSPTYWLPWAVMSFRDEVTTQAENQGLGRIADQDTVYVTLQTGNGSIDSQLYDKAIGYILCSLLGAAPSSAGGGSPYTHTYTLSQTNTPVTLSLYWEDPDRQVIYPMVTVDSLQVTVEPAGIVQYTIGFKSKCAKDWTDQTPDFTSLGSKFLHQHLHVKLASAIAGLAAATELSLKNFDMTINRNSAFDDILGTVEPIDVLVKELGVEGTMKLKLEDDTYHDYNFNGTHMAMEVYLYRSATSSWKLQFPRVSFTKWEPDYTLAEIASQTISFKANYDAANATDIISTCELINAKSSY